MDRNRLFLLLATSVTYLGLSGHFRPMKNETRQQKTADCAVHFVLASDVGRLGNQFFQYLSAQLTADVLNMKTFVTPTFAAVYDRYFTGRKDAAVNWNFMKSKCDLLPSDCIPLPIYKWPKRPIIFNSSLPLCIKIEGIFMKNLNHF